MTIRVSPNTVVSGTQLTVKKRVIHVNTVANRPDVYTADGSEERPYLTIAAATAVAAAGDEIKVAPGTYAEAVVLPAQVGLIGNGEYGSVIVDGNLTSGAGWFTLRGITVAATHVLTLSGNCNVEDCLCLGRVAIGDAVVHASNFSVTTAALVAVTLNHANAQLILDHGTISTTGANEAILGTQGILNLTNCTVQNNDGAVNAIHSITGQLQLFNSTVINAGAGPAIDCAANGAAAGNPNVLHNVRGTGIATFGATVTQLDNVQMGAITGTGIIYPSSSNRVFSTHAAVQLATGGSQIDAALNGNADQWFHPQCVVVRLTGVTNVPNGNAQITIGSEGHAGVNILPATVLAGLVALNDQFVIGLNGFFPGIAGDALLHVTVTFADTGAAAVATAEVKVVGYTD